MQHEERQILVTGGAGFIGCNLLRFLHAVRPTWRFVNLDALTYAGSRETLRDLEGDRYTFVHGDVRDPAAVRSALRGCDGVIHLAAESHVDRSIGDSAPFISTNIEGTQVLLDACRHVGTIERVVHVSTDEVYGELPLDRLDLRFTEDSPLRPSSPYAASKAAADLLALAQHRTFGLPVIVTRCSNNFGPYQYPEKVIPLFVTNLIDGRPVPLYGDGRNVRDWIHVIDHVEALLAVLEHGRPGGVYNIGADNEHSNLALTHAILQAMGRPISCIEPVPDRPGHDRRYAIDASRLRMGLGWRPTRSAWPEGLLATVAWYRENEAWWRPRALGAAVHGVAC